LNSNMVSGAALALRIVGVIVFAVCCGASPFQPLEIPDLNPPTVHGTNTSGRNGILIVGGRDALLGEFPWQVALRDSWESSGSMCGGAILNTRTIITAAHCLDSLSPSQVTVIGGAHWIFDSDGNEQLRSVASFNIHPQYDPYEIHNDIALLTLSQPLVFGSRIQSIKIPSSGTIPLGSCTAVGWGSTRSHMDPSYPDVLQKVELNIVERDTCEEIMDEWKPINDGMICANGHSSGTCVGDSGSGFICRDFAGSYLAGVVSWGQQPSCRSNPDIPSIFTNIAHYARWIQSTLEQNMHQSG